MPIEQIRRHAHAPDIVLSHGANRATLSLQGAHITELVLSGQSLLWCSQSARYERGVAIRGGIPLCWPWFGASLDDSGWPQHGFARTAPFFLVSESSTADYTAVVLALDPTAAIDGWQGRATLEVEIRLGDQLWMELRTTNISDEPLPLGVGLHSYFAVSGIEQIAIPAVTGLEYLDKPTDYGRVCQQEPLAISGEIDRVYQDAAAVTELHDNGSQRTITIDAYGHTDLVIWNPGAQVAAAMADFDDTGYLKMVCIEPAIALDKRVLVQPGECYRVGQTISCRSSH